MTTATTDRESRSIEIRCQHRATALDKQRRPTGAPVWCTRTERLTYDAGADPLAAMTRAAEAAGWAFFRTRKSLALVAYCPIHEFEATR